MISKSGGMGSECLSYNIILITYNRNLQLRTVFFSCITCTFRCAIFFVAMKKTDPNNKKPTRTQTTQQQQKNILEPVPVHPEQAMKTALDIALQKAREIGKKYSEEEEERNCE